jgi:hypothetical protein
MDEASTETDKPAPEVSARGTQQASASEQDNQGSEHERSSTSDSIELPIDELEDEQEAENLENEKRDEDLNP